MSLCIFLSRTWPSRTSLSCPLLCSLALIALACPADDSGTETGADSSASGTASSTTEPAQTSTTEPSTTSATSSTTEPPVTSDDTATATSEPPTTDDTADSGETGPTVACGELSCSESEWCDWSDEACGEGGFRSTSCEPRPEPCPTNEEFVCGCDGQTHSNPCIANRNGVDFDAEGDCPAPEGWFRCGYRFCHLQYHYCQVQLSDIGGVGDIYECVDPGPVCGGDITCDCLGAEPCFDLGCNPTPDGGEEIVCPGG